MVGPPEWQGAEVWGSTAEIKRLTGGAGVESARRLQKLLPYFESGEFQPLPIAARYSLDAGCRLTKPSPTASPAGWSSIPREAITCRAI